MVCADTTSVIAFWDGETGHDIELVAQAAVDCLLVLPPVALTELLSDPSLPAPWEKSLLEMPFLEILPGYWERAGKLRASLLSRRFNANLPDTLITQSCLDHDVPLTTRDRDFRPFQKLAGLRLL